MKITAITCTGGRPELFALCRRWLLRQTVQPTRWLVTTDCDDLPHAPEADVVRIPASVPLQTWRNHSPALRALLYAMSLVEDDSAVVVFEDDDWYGERYIEKVMEDPHWCAHQSMMHLYHLPSRRFASGVYPSPVEGMLAFKGGNKKRVIDWLAHHPRPELDSKHVTMHELVQIKGVGFGLPGRTGATRKHITGHHKLKGMKPDPDLKVFRDLLGADADAYLSLLQCV